MLSKLTPLKYQKVKVCSPHVDSPWMIMEALTICSLRLMRLISHQPAVTSFNVILTILRAFYILR